MNLRRIKKLSVVLLVPVVMMTGCKTTENKQEVTESSKEHNAEKNVGQNIEQQTEEPAEPKAEIQTEEKGTDKKTKKNLKKFSENQNFQPIKSGAYSENGFYTYDEDAACIYYVDKKSFKTHVLCSNIGCNHSNNQCSAYFVDCNGVYYTGDYLYVLASDNSGTYTCLNRVKPDGSEKEEVAKLFSYEEEDMACALNFIIHKGYGYMTINWLDVEASKERRQVLYKVSLEDGSKEEIYEMYGYCPVIDMVNTDKNNIYFCTELYKNGNQFDVEEKAFVYNIKDDSVTPIDVKGNMLLRAVYGDKIYAIKRERKLSKYMNYYEIEFEIHRLDRNGKDSKCIYAMPKEELDKGVEIQIINIDENYIYLFGNINLKKDFLKIISHDGKQIYTYEDDSIPKCLWSDGTSLLMQDMKIRDYILRDIKTGKDTVVKQ